jgi:hypothetical protein
MEMKPAVYQSPDPTQFWFWSACHHSRKMRPLWSFRGLPPTSNTLPAQAQGFAAVVGKARSATMARNMSQGGKRRMADEPAAIAGLASVGTPAKVAFAACTNDGAAAQRRDVTAFQGGPLAGQLAKAFARPAGRKSVEAPNRAAEVRVQILCAPPGKSSPSSIMWPSGVPSRCSHRTATQWRS